MMYLPWCTWGTSSFLLLGMSYHLCVVSYTAGGLYNLRNKPECWSKQWFMTLFTLSPLSLFIFIVSSRVGLVPCQIQPGDKDHADLMRWQQKCYGGGNLMSSSMKVGTIPYNVIMFVPVLFQDMVDFLMWQTDMSWYYTCCNFRWIKLPSPLPKMLHDNLYQKNEHRTTAGTALKNKNTTSIGFYN